MKAFRRFVLALGLTSASLGVYAQSDNPYLDDAYLSQKDIEQREAKAKAAAQARYREALEQQKRYEAEQEKRLEAYKARQRDREIDAYNGRLPEDEDPQRIEQYREGRPERRGSTEVHIYGPYSERLARFHGDGTVIVTSPNVYIDRDYYAGGHTTLSLHIGGSSWYPWYDSFYPSSYYYSGFYHRPYHWYRYGSRWGWHPYDAFYSPYHSPYYHDSWAWGYYGGYYSGLYGYYDGYYRGLADRAYTDHYYRNAYSHGARSGGRYYGSGADRSSYGAYRSASASGYERSYSDGGYRSGSYSSGSYSGGSQSRSGRSYGGSTRYQSEARLPQQSRGSYSSSQSSSYERSYSGSSSSGSSRSYSSPASVSSPSPSSRGTGIRERHR